MKFDLEIYNSEGKCLDKIDSIFSIKKKLSFPAYIGIKKFLNKDVLKNKQNLFAKIICKISAKFIKIYRNFSYCFTPINFYKI